MVDQDGNTISVGSKLWMPVTVTSLPSGGGCVVQTAYSGAELNVVGEDTKVYKKPGNFPDLDS